MCQQNCAKSFTPPNPLGLAGFLVSLFGLIFTLGIICPFGLVLSMLAMFSKRRGFATAGMILGMVGTMIVGVGVASIALAASTVHHYQVELPQRAETAQILDKAFIDVEAYRNQHGKLPEGIEGNKMVLKHLDAYGKSVRYEPEGSKSFAIRSAGPDGRFDTPDDMRTTQVLPQTNVKRVVYRSHRNGCR